MSLDEFCHRLESLNLSIVQKALALLWFHDEATPNAEMTAGELARLIHQSGLGNPHSTKLTQALKTSGFLLQRGAKFSLKALSRGKIREMLLPILGPAEPEINQQLGYLPEQVWTETRGYIEKIAIQLNGCFQFGFFDAASVLIRRLIETLIIEAYEALRRESEIRDGNGNYLMLKGLIDAAVGHIPLGLGRDAALALRAVKELGDRSAHNRRFLAVKADLEKIQSGVRVTVDELIGIAQLRRTVGK